MPLTSASPTPFSESISSTTSGGALAARKGHLPKAGWLKVLSRKSQTAGVAMQEAFSSDEEMAEAGCYRRRRSAKPSLTRLPFHPRSLLSPSCQKVPADVNAGSSADTAKFLRRARCVLRGFGSVKLLLTHTHPSRPLLLLSHEFEKAMDDEKNDVFAPALERQHRCVPEEPPTPAYTHH